MTHDQLGQDRSRIEGFGLGFGIDGVKEPLSNWDHCRRVRLGRILLYGILDRSERTDDRDLHGATASDGGIGRSTVKSMSLAYQAIND